MRHASPFCLSLLIGAVACGHGSPPSVQPADAAPQTTATASPRRDPPHVELPRLDRATASRFAALSLACVDREYPNKPDTVLNGPEDVRPSRANAPAFYGCYDWHSAVHGHWALVRVLGLFPDLEEAGAIRATLSRHLSPANIAAELEFFRRPSNALLERPYGWGWLLRLAAELHTSRLPEARAWEAAVRPLAEHLASRTLEYLERLSAPVRHGNHPNTAFAILHALAYARATGSSALAASLEQRARSLYGADVGCPVAYEPSGEDFLSPCLAEADLMRTVLPPAELGAWLDRFLPAQTWTDTGPLAHPVEVKDRRDARIGHLIGLGMQRAWSLEAIASSLGKDDPRRAQLRRLAALHGSRAILQMHDSGYGGEHWLASFAIYLLSGVEAPAAAEAP